MCNVLCGTHETMMGLPFARSFARFPEQCCPLPALLLQTYFQTIYAPTAEVTRLKRL